jgi:hypothetical protein
LKAHIQAENVRNLPLSKVSPNFTFLGKFICFQKNHSVLQKLCPMGGKKLPKLVNLLPISLQLFQLLADFFFIFSLCASSGGGT